MTLQEILNETQFLLGYEKDRNFAIYKKADMIAHSNRALDRLSALILDVDNSWQWDDSNYPDLPIATTKLIKGRRQYTLDKTQLKVRRVEVQDSSGKYYRLRKIDEKEVNNSLYEFMKEEGSPQYYDLSGESLLLYPPAAYTQEKGIMLYSERGAEYFSETSMDKTPGIPSLFHGFIPLYNAQHFASAKPDLVQKYEVLKGRLQELEREIQKYYRRRTGRKKLSGRKISGK